MDLKELDLVDPSRHWYYQSKLVAVRRAVNRRVSRNRHIVDVGAGSGFFSIQLADLEAGDRVTCIDPFYADDSVTENGSVCFFREVSQPQGDVYLFIDVLEHVDDDVALLRKYTDTAPPGALVVISVPAFQSLWSNHDVFLEHRRRYRMSQVVSMAERAGLCVLDRQYLFGVIFPAAWLWRRLHRSGPAASDLRPVGRVLNSLLTTVVSAEHRIGHNTLAGLSAFVVAQVPATR